MKGGDTRDRILEVAARLFHEQGFEATTVATILRTARVNSGSLYHFFPSKGALLVGVLERYVESLPSAVLEPTEMATGDPIERVFALLEVYRRRLLVSDCTRGSPIGDLALEVGSRDPHARALIEAYFSAWADGVRGWLEAAGARLPADLDRSALARFVLAVMEGAVMQARVAGTLEPFDVSVARLRSHLDLLLERARRERGEAEREGVITGDDSGSSDRLPEKAMPGEHTGWRAW